MAIADLLTQLASDRDDLADNLVTMGVVASQSETITDLVPKVLQISGGGGVEITDITLNADGTYTVTDKDNNTHTLAVTETDGQITAITYDGNNVPLSFSSGELTGVGDTDIDVSRYPEPSRLPSTLQEVEYIEATGTQYIDTELIGCNGVYMDYQITDTSTGYRAVIGAMTTDYKRKYIIFTNNGYNIIAYEETDVNISSVDTNRHTIENNIIDYNIKFDNTVIGTTGSFTTSSNAMFIFARTDGSSALSLAKARIYALRLYKNRVLERDFIPCYNKNTGVIGLFDICGCRFYTNQGTGVFLKGGDV